MRSLAALVQLVIGTTFLAVGVALLGWSLLRAVWVEKAFDAAMWVARHAPASLELTPEVFGNRVINDQWPMMVGAFGVMALMMASSYLRGARRDSRPAGVSSDGEARLVLKGANPRVGKTLEGELVLSGNNLVGQHYDIRVECRRRDGKYGKAYRTDYSDSVHVLAVAGAGGARLPFRFEIPLTAPPSRAWEPFSLQDPREWQLVCARSKAWLRASFFPLRVDPGPAKEVADALAAMPPAVVGPFPWKLAGGIVGGLLGVLTLLFLIVDTLISFFRATATP